MVSRGDGMVPNNVMAREQHPPAAYWLIVESNDGQEAMLTVDLDDHTEALAVFGSQEEAEMFLHLGTSQTRWRLRKTTAGELVSILFTFWTDLGFVVLDPLPELISEGVVGLVRLSREDFIDHLIGSVETLVP